jgi:iron(III) transport system permease protein
MGGALLLFVLWPVGSVVRESFLLDGRFSAEAWRGLLSGNWQLVFNSFAVAVCVTAATVPLAVLLALKLLYGSRRGRLALMGMLALSTISPPFVGAMSYLMLFGRRGLITWRLLGLEWDPYGFAGIVLMECFSMLGVATLLAAASFRQMDGALERSSQDLGATPFQTVLKVSLPLALPGIFEVMMLVMVRSLSDFATPLFVGGRFQVLASRAYNTLVSVGDFPLACAMNCLLLLPSLLLLFWQGRGLEKNFSLRLKSPHSLRLNGPAAWAAEACCTVFIIIQCLVYGLIFWGSVMTTWGVNFSFTTEHLRALFGFQGASYARSLVCSLTAGLGGALAGAVLARLIRNSHTRAGLCLQVAADLPYLVPGTFFGVGYLLVSSSLPWELPVTFLIAVNCLFRQLSPALRSAQAGQSQINPELELALRDLGGSPMRVISDLLLPLLRPFMLVAFINGFSASMTSTGPIIFLVTPRAKVAAIELFDSINIGDFGAATAMASLLIVTVLAVNLAALAFTYLSEKGAKKTC